MVSIDKVGVIVIFGFVSLVITFLFNKRLLGGFGWLKQFAMGSSFYLVLSSLYFAITGNPFWNDTLEFYRFVLAVGAIVYLGSIMDNYGIYSKKK